MKNVLTFLMVAMLAVATQAATVISWNSGTLYRINPDGTLSGTKMNASVKANAYLFLLSEEEYNALNVVDIVSTYMDVTESSAVLKSGVTASVTGATAKTGIATLKTTVEAAPTDKFYAAIIYTFTDTEGNVWLNANKGFDSVNEQHEQNNEASGNLGTIGGFGATGWYKAVPEPTTVALLAFGLAAVGLKRKRA